MKLHMNLVRSIECYCNRKSQECQTRKCKGLLKNAVTVKDYITIIGCDCMKGTLTRS